MIKIIRKLLFTALLLSLSTSAVFAEVWKMATPFRDGNFHAVNNRTFANEVAEATGDALRIEIHSGGSLVKHPQIKGAVHSGTVEIGEMLLARLGDEDPVFELDSVPFLAVDYTQANRLWQTSRDVIADKLAKRGLKLLYAVPWPPQGIYLKKQIHTVKDLAQSNFRVYSPAMERFAQLINAVAVDVQARDIAEAFNSGKIDTMISSPTTGVDTKAWEYASYFYHTQAWVPKNVVFVNSDAFLELAPAIQEALVAAGSRAQERGWAASQAETEEKISVLQSNGMNVVFPDAALMDSFEAVGDVMIGEWVAKTDDAGRQVLADYLGE